MRELVVIPLKSFARAKGRLRAAGIAPDELVRRLAAAVVAASSPRSVVVVTSDDDIVTFATELGVEVLADSPSGLNEAAEYAYQELAGRADRLIIAHGDLAFPKGLGQCVFESDVTLVTDQRGRGTNVLVLPAGLDWRFHYGPDSRSQHEAEARRLGLACAVWERHQWSVDVDEPEDVSAVT